MKNIKRFIVFLALYSLAVTARAEKPLAVGVNAGTAGVGVQLHLGLTERLNLRAGYNHLSTSQDVDAEDNNGVPDDELEYSGDLKLDTLSFVADWHPWAGNFHISLGGVLNNNDLVVETRCNNPSGCEVGGSQFSRTAIGTITTDIDFKDFGPYLGMGWGNPVAGDVGLHWRFELGAIYAGEASVEMESNGDCGLFQSACNNALQNEERELEDDLSDLKWFPVVQLGLSYRFR